VSLFFWSYLAYPALIRRLAARAHGRTKRPTSAAAEAPPPSIEVLVAAADEEDSIEARIANLLAQDAPGPFRIAIGCDGCRDRTAERARTSGSPALRVFEFPIRRGKAAVLNALARESDADLLLFTDANTRFEPGAVRGLAEAFADPGVGAACGRLLFETAAHGRETPESVFWDRETSLKEAEGALGVCVGANGGIYAARRELVSPLPEDTTSMDDFLIPVRVARRGRGVVFVGTAVAREDAAPDVAAEVARRFRIGIGGGQVLRRETWLWAISAHPLLTIAFLSRKVARWIAPLLALAAAAAALFVPALRVAGAVTLGLGLLLLAAAWVRPRLRGAGGRLYYFAVLNAALAFGVAAGLCGYSRAVWSRTARS
jgi:cellulose synthase/poly-beta-1,6-N-acetylglucosamine synthase-like glycosyltransferase